MVDAGERLVPHHQVALAGQGAGDQDALLLTAGHGGEALPGAVGDRYRVQGGRDGGPVGGGLGPERTAAAEASARHDLARGGLLDEDAAALGHIPDPGPVPELAQRGAEEFHLALVGREAKHRPDQGRLAGAVVAQHGHRLAGRDLQ